MTGPLVKEFEKIRDIPYSIPLEIGEEDNCCSGKMKRFKKILDTRGYKSRYRVCEFRWSDLDLPEEVTSVEHDNNSTHVFMEIRIDDEWIRVDPTWDKGLHAIVPVNNWDGRNSTELAVKPTKIYGVEKSRKIVDDETNEDIEKDLQINGKFYKQFNEWLESIRL